MSILVKKISKNLDFGQNFQKYVFWWKLSKNMKYQNYRKISILVKIVANYRFWSIFTKMSILVIIEEYIDFNQNFQKDFDFDQHFRKISILVNIFGEIDLWQNFPQIFRWKFTEMSILVIIEENFDFRQNFQKDFDIGQNFRKSRFWLKFSKNYDFGQCWWKSRFLSKFTKNLDFGQHFRKM